MLYPLASGGNSSDCHFCGTHAKTRRIASTERGRESTMTICELCHEELGQMPLFAKKKERPADPPKGWATEPLSAL